MKFHIKEYEPSPNTAYVLRAIALALRAIYYRKRRICWFRYMKWWFSPFRDNPPPRTRT